jgi:hypothetical protein
LFINLILTIKLNNGIIITTGGIIINVINARSKRFLPRKFILLIAKAAKLEISVITSTERIVTITLFLNQIEKSPSLKTWIKFARVGLLGNPNRFL